MQDGLFEGGQILSQVQCSGNLYVLMANYVLAEILIDLARDF